MTDQPLILEQGHQRLIRARHGCVLYNRNDTVIGRLVETYGDYFENEVNVFRRFVAAGNVVLDVGANIGVHTLALARLVGPGGFVFAFEPQRLVFQTLCANMALNSLDHVHCVNAAVADVPGWLNLIDPDPAIPNNYGGADVATLSGGPQLPAIAQLVLDDFLNVSQLGFVKIDIEGMEAAALRGARQTIARFKPALYVENAFVEKSPELVTLLWELGYQCFWHLPLYVTGSNHFQVTEQIFPIAFFDRGDAHLDGVGFAINLLCVHSSLNLPIEGLRPVLDPQEHPYRRDCVHLFSGPQGGGIPLLKA